MSESTFDKEICIDYNREQERQYYKKLWKSIEQDRADLNFLLKEINELLPKVIDKSHYSYEACALNQRIDDLTLVNYRIYRKVNTLTNV